MKKIIKNSIIAGLLTLSFTGLTAIPAQAVTTSSTTSSVCVGTSLWSIRDTRYDFNWFEELQGKRDYTVRYYQYRIGYNHPYCTGPIGPIRIG